MRARPIARLEAANLVGVADRAAAAADPADQALRQFVTSQSDSVLADKTSPVLPVAGYLPVLRLVSLLLTVLIVGAADSAVIRRDLVSVVSSGSAASALLFLQRVVIEVLGVVDAVIPTSWLWPVSLRSRPRHRPQCLR